MIDNFAAYVVRFLAGRSMPRCRLKNKTQLLSFAPWPTFLIAALAAEDFNGQGVERDALFWGICGWETLRVVDFVEVLVVTELLHDLE